MKTFITKSAPWMGYVLAAVAILYTVMAGGITTQTFPGKNGAGYSVKIDMPTGVVDLIDKCSNMDVEGATCPVAISATVTTVKAPVKPAAEDVIPKENKPVAEIKTDTEKPADAKVPDAETKEEPEKLNLLRKPR